MKLRFEVDQAEAFRRGVDCPKSIVTIDVQPSRIPECIRHLIADRMQGIDVCELTLDESREPAFDPITTPNGAHVRLKVILPTFESLVDAVIQDERNWQARNRSASQLGAWEREILKEWNQYKTQLRIDEAQITGALTVDGLNKLIAELPTK